MTASIIKLVLFLDNPHRNNRICFKYGLGAYRGSKLFCVLFITSIFILFINIPSFFPNVNADSGPNGPEISNVFCQPDPQEIGCYVNITCEVDDPVGVFGVWVNISLPGGGYTNVSMLNGNGSKWYHNDSYSVLGIYNNIIWARNTNNTWNSSSGYSYTIQISRPQLTEPSVFPMTGYINTWFNFSVNYSHPFNLPPDKMTLNLTGPSEGTFNLIDTDLSDTDYTDGKRYFYNASGLILGTYCLYFAANDSTGSWAQDTNVIYGPEIIPKPAFLSVINGFVEENEATSLIAMLADNDGYPIANELVRFFLDKNKNGIYEGSEFLGVGTTLASGVATRTYSADIEPGIYGVWAKYIGSLNYNVSEIEGQLSVQNFDNNPPTILRAVPNQIKPEDSPPWTLDLSSYEADFEDSNEDLKWFLTGVDTNLYSVTGENSSDDILTFIPMKNAFGSDVVNLWLGDRSGYRVSQPLWINITPSNDPPFFYPRPPDLQICYDDPFSWNYTFYTHDVETQVNNLTLTTSEPTVDLGQGYAEVQGLKVIFSYPQSREGKSILVTLTLSDGADVAQTVILVNITSNQVPDLIKKIPDFVLEENFMLNKVIDLDEHFSDEDHNDLVFSSDSSQIIVNIGEDNNVDIASKGKWVGIEFVTFRATNPLGAIMEDTIRVTVLSTNDPPQIDGVPDIVVHYDYSYGFDFSPYISDPDNNTSELSIWTSESTDKIWLNTHNHLGIIVNYPKSMNGTTLPVTIYVSDGIYTASFMFQIKVSDGFPPELIKRIPDVYFDEDTSLANEFTLNDYFLDSDSAVLNFFCYSELINVTINEDSTVDFSAPENWYGSEHITFRVQDDIGAISEARIQVVVVPVNDPPTIGSIPRLNIKGMEQWKMDLSLYIDDIDNDLSELNITFRSEDDQEYVTLVGNILVIQNPEEVRDDIITVVVSDGELETERSFTVSNIGPTPAAPSIWEIAPWLLLFLFATVGGAFTLQRKKSRFWIYEAFLIHEKNMPIAHASHEKISELEEVVSAGMFNTVQQFIQDAFSGKTDDDVWELDEMAFGDNKILIERSQNLYLAVIFGGNGEALRNRIKKLLSDIDDEFGDVLDDWEGDVSQLMGVETMIAGLITEKLKQSKSEPPEEYFEDKSVEQDDGMDENECPVCGANFVFGDTNCSGCGVEFAKIENLSFLSSK
ncbi:MAG: hypothetical protein JSV09_12865 [Thermoplasmata archaeon]|nr:MAG: hypothetical protein JSV09_12865 [Thermoplasmata archaeon]